MSAVDLYRDIVLDHWRNPRSSTPLAEPTHENTFTNASCGDSAFVQLTVTDGVITNVSVRVSGCALSTASASVLAENLVGQTLEEIQQLSESDIRRLLGDVDPIPARAKCLTLGLEAIQQINANH